MPISDYLRLQADACLRIARAGFDLGTAERLRVLASELRTKAEELDEEQESRDDERSFQPHIQQGQSRNGSSGSSRNGSEGGF